jgi:dihydroorotate dehydrogenase electron transfer subunit
MLSQHSIPVVSTETLRDRIFRLTLFSPLISQKAKPGNFVHIRVCTSDYPLLRRAFSIHAVDKHKKSFDILFRVIGEGTQILSTVNPGATLDILGPIGNNFTLPRKSNEIILVAGGMGIAPLWFLLTHLKDKEFDPARITFLYGTRTKGELLYLEKFKKIKVRLILTTDDGSKGEKGLVTDSFLRELKKRKQDHSNLTIYSCGPQMMLAKMSDLAKDFNLPCQISLETHMACGVGACWGCVVKSSDGTYRRVCADGPVFDAREVNL